MFAAYLSPLAPTVTLLLSAFILFIVMPWLPSLWRTKPWVENWFATGLVGVAGLMLLFIQLTLGLDATGLGLSPLFGWQLSPDFGYDLNIRADELSLVFLILTLLLLLVVTLMSSPFWRSDDRLSSLENWRSISIWLAIGASACFLFVSANLLTVAYAILAFDFLLAIYWLRQGHSNRTVSRLFLGFFSATALTLIGAFDLTPSNANDASQFGLFLVGGALWLRLGFFPFIEMAGLIRWDDDERLAYLGLSLIVGLYLLMRVLSAPLPDIMLWFTALIMLFSGLLTWLTNRSPVWLIYLIVTEILFLLLVTMPFAGEPGGLSTASLLAITLVLPLSLIALWVTPSLGRPNFQERAWLWLYLPAAAATINLVGVPFTLGWVMRTELYKALLKFDNFLFIIIALLAEALALSGLVRYWLVLWQGENGHPHRRLAIGIVVTVPFLLPGLGMFVLTRLTQLTFPTVDFAQSVGAIAALIIVVGGAIALAYYRDALMMTIPLPSARVARLARLGWLWPLSRRWLSRLGKVILRIDVVLQGQHYVGWAIFITLIGVLIIFLQT